MSTDSWFADYTAGAFFPAPRKTHDWWEGFGTGLADMAGALTPEEPERREWLSDPQSVAGYLFVMLAHSAVTVDAGAVRLDRAAEDCQRLLEHLGVEPVEATPSNVLPFRPVKGGTR